MFNATPDETKRNRASVEFTGALHGLAADLGRAVTAMARIDAHDYCGEADNAGAMADRFMALILEYSATEADIRETFMKAAQDCSDHLDRFNAMVDRHNA